MNPLKWALDSRPIQTDLGLLVVRLGVGLSMMVFHGYGKLTGGPERWTSLGGNMAKFGLDFAPAFWGFMAGFAEGVCSLLLILGVLFRPAAFLLAFTMLVASVRHITLPPEANNAGWSGASHALELLAVYVALFLTGPGRYRFGRTSR